MDPTSLARGYAPHGVAPPLPHTSAPPTGPAFRRRPPHHIGKSVVEDLKSSSITSASGGSKKTTGTTRGATGHPAVPHTKKSPIQSPSASISPHHHHGNEEMPTYGDDFFDHNPSMDDEDEREMEQRIFYKRATSHPSAPLTEARAGRSGVSTKPPTKTTSANVSGTGLSTPGSRSSSQSSKSSASVAPPSSKQPQQQSNAASVQTLKNQIVQALGAIREAGLKQLIDFAASMEQQTLLSTLLAPVCLLAISTDGSGEGGSQAGGSARKSSSGSSKLSTKTSSSSLNNSKTAIHPTARVLSGRKDGRKNRYLTLVTSTLESSGGVDAFLVRLAGVQPQNMDYHTIRAVLDAVTANERQYGTAVSVIGDKLLRLLRALTTWSRLSAELACQINRWDPVESTIGAGVDDSEYITEDL